MIRIAFRRDHTGHIWLATVPDAYTLRPAPAAPATA
jgi:hypothetical protein